MTLREQRPGGRFEFERQLPHVGLADRQIRTEGIGDALCGGVIEAHTVRRGHGTDHIRGELCSLGHGFRGGRKIDPIIRPFFDLRFSSRRQFALFNLQGSIRKPVPSAPRIP
ncbi:MAG: hypothetical protein ACKVQT_30335, partial [Burkholderiales bacterium]